MRRALTLALLGLLHARSAGAQGALPEARVRMRLDALFRGVPRYVLTASERQATADERYWRATALAPWVSRAVLDASGLYRGRVEAHLSAWGAVDLAVSDPGHFAAGDLAVAWARGREGPWSVWLGRRFVPWGPPGGLHVDGVGVEARAGAFEAEAMVGRPVTPAYGGAAGAQPGFDGVTATSGARLGWASPGRAAVSVSYVERWARGVAGVRALSLDASASPHAKLELRGSLALDAAGVGVSQASADLEWFALRALTVGAGYGHVDPSRLLPRWSILSVFATDVFDEARLSLAWRPSRAVSLRVEGAGQRYATPGAEEAARWGHRVEGALRVSSSDRARQCTVSASRRDDGVRPLTVIRVAGLWTVGGALALALEAALAVDDDGPSSPRTSAYTRGSVEVPLGGAWRLGASVDGVRSPLAVAELRGLVHASWTFERGGRP
ncbi:MAG: hypothetical protein HY909_06215 [Deltaproteobacteria bacterium]|nr:hypothetical protein [Deltaproteobacteria bacterium]